MEEEWLVALEIFLDLEPFALTEFVFSQPVGSLENIAAAFTAEANG